MPSDILEPHGSWAEMVKTIEMEKKQLPWDRSAVEPVKRVNLVERKVRERDLDPITMAYRDDKREKSAAATKADFHATVVQRAEDIRQNKYNIISQQGPPRKIDTLPRHDKSNLPRDWHFLSHLTLKDHATVSANYDEKYHLERAHKQPEQSIRVPQRAFDIISNKFNKGDSERLRAEYNDKKEYILKKYWSTHDYDFVKGKYCDGDKEDLFRDQRSLLSEVQGEAQALRIPPSTLYSEGNCYNILNNEPVHPDRLEAFTATKERSVTKSAKFKSIETTMTNAGIRIADIQAERRLNRVSYQRWQPEIDRGYHIIRHDLTVVNPAQRRPEDVWDKVSSSGSLLVGMHTQSSPALLGPPVSDSNSRDSNSRDYSKVSPVITSSMSSSTLSPIPGLDLTQTAPQPRVQYSEQSGVGKGQLVPMVLIPQATANAVRTGGFNKAI